MKKLLFINILMLSCLFASTEAKQSFKDQADYQEFVSMLENSAKKGDGQKAYALGLLYLQPVQIADQVSKVDTEKGLHWLDRAEKLGEKMASWQKGMLALTTDQPETAKSIFEYVLDNDNGKDEIAYLMSATSYGAIVLEKDIENEKELKKASSLLRPFAIRFADNANIQYIFAHLLFYSGNENEGDIWLNAACRNPKAPQRIIDVCNGSENIEVFDEDGQSLGSCPLL